MSALLRQQQSANRELEGEIMKLRSALEQAEAKNRETFEDNKLMVGQIKVLEQRKNELLEKLKLQQEKEAQQLQDRSGCRKDIDQLVARTQELERALALKDQALRTMDCERDELQNELDRETEERADLRRQLEVLERESRSACKGMEEREYSLNELQRRLSKAEEERDKMDSSYAKQYEELLQLRDQLAKAEAALRELHNEVQLLTLSDRDAARELDKLRARNAEWERKLRDRTREAEEERERATALSIFNAELQTELEKERGEVGRLGGFVGELEEANNSMYQQLEGKDQQLEEMHFALDEAQRNNHLQLQEIANYQRQLQHSAQDCQALQEELRASERQREALRAERNWKKDAVGSQEWKAKQEERLSQLQADYDRNRLEVDHLRHRNRQLEDLLNDHRANAFAQETPAKTVLVESRVESYEGENYNNSNLHSRRNQSLPLVRDDLSEPESIQSSKDKIRRLEQMYLQTTRPK